VKAARFEHTTTIEDFDFSFNPKIPDAKIRDLATLHFVDAGESVILHGPVGVGKSMIAQALGHRACRRGHSVIFTKTSRLLADLARRPRCVAVPLPRCPEERHHISLGQYQPAAFLLYSEELRFLPRKCK
jgi:hypothetical protein